MAKSKNHTNHNQNRKAHRNDIKRPTRFRHEFTLRMDQKLEEENISEAEAKKRYEERMANRAGKPKPVTL